ncbi:MAG TPA: class E sortase [Methanobacteriaceae archaeon]|nr:class E sortase [Methanobacteriaceae archaeon]
MRKYRVYSVLILFSCIFLSLGIVMAGFDQFDRLQSAQKSITVYKEKMSNPVNALDPTSASAGYLNYNLAIPKLGVNCNIRGDTVNAYNSVYHYSESVMPGQPGECGLLGHRTTYSGLFKNIGSLQVGDEVIIRDYNSQKKYVYQVTSNGNDIRWDYKTNPIRFAQEGEPRLLIMTCYPPGRKQAAYIMHCKLVSSGPLK